MSLQTEHHLNAVCSLWTLANPSGRRDGAFSFLHVISGGLKRPLQKYWNSVASESKPSRCDSSVSFNSAYCR